MAEPLAEVGQEISEVGRPLRVAVLAFEPGEAGGQLVRGGLQREAVFQIGATIGEREELGVQQIEAPRHPEHHGRAREDAHHAFGPSVGQDVSQLSGTVVEPVIGEHVARLGLVSSEGARGFRDGWWQRRREHVHVLREPRDDAHEHQRRSADDDALETQPMGGEVAIEGFERGAGKHGGIGLPDTP